jgi:hypothetical protein
MKTQPSPPRRRNPVAKALRHHPGGPHRGTPSRADRKRELRRQLDATAPAGRSP